MMSNKNLCILFTGQGSQYPEMGLDLSNNFKWVKDRYKKSSDILGYDVLKTQQDILIQKLDMAAHVVKRLETRLLSAEKEGDRLTEELQLAEIALNPSKK